MYDNADGSEQTVSLSFEFVVVSDFFSEFGFQLILPHKLSCKSMKWYLSYKILVHNSGDV